MSTEAFEVGHCPRCKSERADVRAEFYETFDHPDINGGTNYKVIQCRGCGKVYFKTVSWDSESGWYSFNPLLGCEEYEHDETVKYWPPASSRRRPEWHDDLHAKDGLLWSLTNDVYIALDNNLGVLAAIGMRTAFDRASELLGIPTGLSFEKKLDQLRTEEHVTTKERKLLAVLVDAGSAAAHRGWRPSSAQLDNMTIILEAFLHRAFLLPSIGEELDKAVPKRTES